MINKTEGLIEICLICGFVHRDDRTKTRQKKAHYHWIPKKGEISFRGNVIHATVCVSCIESNIDWSKYSEARKNTPDKFYIIDSYNASLPGDIHDKSLDDKYYLQTEALIADWSLEREYIRKMK